MTACKKILKLKKKKKLIEYFHYGKWRLMRINRLNKRRIWRQHPLKDKVVPAHTTKAYRGSGGIAPLILTLGTKWEVN